MNSCSRQQSYNLSWSLSPVDDDLLVPIITLPELFVPPSPSDTSSTVSLDFSSPRPRPLHVVCSAPLVAPIPLPYHSPTFLQFELPDIDQDLSHPPYTRRSSTKRKRISDEVPNDQTPPKKRPIHQSFTPHSHCHTSDNGSLRHHTMQGKRSRVYTHT